MKKVLITGGAGYVGSALTAKLIKLGYRVTVFDLFLYGEDVIDDHPGLVKIKGDIRNRELLNAALKDQEYVIHLACISNDPSFELDPGLGRSINLDAFRPLVEMSVKAGVKRFIYASSSSVYGIKEEKNVTEDMSLDPLTDYSKFKAECESILNEYKSDRFTVVTVRPATVCGYSRRLRLDLTVNILTNNAITNRSIKVFGGNQKRPNIHIEDMLDAYVLMLNAPGDKINGQIYNVGYENFPINEIAQMVKKVIGNDVSITTSPTDDLRSYHISSQKIKNELGFVPKHSIEEAVQDLKTAFEEGKVPDSMTEKRYYNVKLMNEVHLK